jgi:hypothetical protein
VNQQAAGTALADDDSEEEMESENEENGENWCFKVKKFDNKWIIFIIYNKI